MRLNNLTIVFEVTRSTGVIHYGAAKTEIESGTNCGVDTHLTHRTANDYVLYLSALQIVKQGRVAKAVRKMLRNNGLVRFRRYDLVYFSAICSRQEKCSARTLGDMLNVKDRMLFASEFSQKVLGIIGSLLHANELHASAREVIILNVDQDQGPLHVTTPFAETNVIRSDVAQAPDEIPTAAVVVSSQMKAGRGCRHLMAGPRASRLQPAPTPAFSLQRGIACGQRG